jgi:hypothetical protein
MQVDVTHSTVWRVLREQQLCPYHLQGVQVFPLKDYHVRVMFCHLFLQQCGTDLNFTASVIFTVEAQFKKDELQSLHDQCVGR